MLAENSVAHCDWKVNACFSPVIRVTCRCTILAIFFMLLYALPGSLSLRKNDITDLIKGGVRPNRIAQIVEERGVGFELDDQALRRLKQGKANETVFVRGCADRRQG